MSFCKCQLIKKTLGGGGLWHGCYELSEETIEFPLALIESQAVIQTAVFLDIKGFVVTICGISWSVDKDPRKTV
jgi:hypothetical protein